MMKKMLILGFFALHALSLGIGSIPADAVDPFSRGLRMLFAPIPDFYLNATGVWQKWNLFAPDPLRAHFSYTVDIASPSREAESKPITPEMFPWYQRTNYFKILRTLSYENHGYDDLRALFLRPFCDKWDLPEGSTLRLRIGSIDVLHPDMMREKVDDPVPCVES